MSDDVMEREIIVTWQTIKGTLGERIAPDRRTAFAWMAEIGDRCRWVDVRDGDELVGAHYGRPSFERTD